MRAARQSGTILPAGPAKVQIHGSCRVCSCFAHIAFAPAHCIACTCPRDAQNKRTMEQAMDVAEIRSRIDEYSSFISSTLRPQLEAAVKAREEVELDIKEYEALQAKLANIEEKKGQSVKDRVVDLGHELIYCKAAIDNPSRIYVHAGMGFHVEMTIDEARTFVGKRIALLKQSLELKTHKATTIAVHIEETILVLQQLGNEASLSQEE